MKAYEIEVGKLAYGIRGTFRHEDDEYPERFNGIYMPVYNGGAYKSAEVKCVNIMTGTVIRLDANKKVEYVDLTHLEPELH